MDILVPQIDDVTLLRLAYMVYKIASFVINITATGAGYWENLSIENHSHSWATVNEQEKNLVKPYGDITR
jgi:hypothetical protein